MATASINGITIAFDDVGEGRDTLLLVHGHPFDRSMWRPQLGAASAAGWRVLAPDLRGYGESTVVPGRTTLDVFAADLAALLDHLDIEDVVIGGLSMGGQIVMEFARRLPLRVRGLMLAATFPQSETDEGRRSRNAMADRLLREGMRGYADDVLPKMLAARSIETLPAVADHVADMMRATDPEGAAAALRGRAERPSYEETLARLAVPALVVVGSEDAFTTRRDAERMRDLLGDSELVWLEGVGHMPNLESPEAFNAAFFRFSTWWARRGVASGDASPRPRCRTDRCSRPAHPSKEAELLDAPPERSDASNGWRASAQAAGLRLPGLLIRPCRRLQTSPDAVRQGGAPSARGRRGDGPPTNALQECIGAPRASCPPGPAAWPARRAPVHPEVRRGIPMRIIKRHIPSSMPGGLAAPAIISAVLVLPFMILELLTRGGFHARFPIALFAVLWLLPLSFILVVRPIVRRPWTNEGGVANSLGLWSRVAVSALIVWFWISLVVDQMPCFLGVPNCD